MSTRHVAFALTILTLGALLGHSSAWAQSPSGQSNGKRFALVIGNKSYPRGALDNPGNDAFVMDAVLRQLGFTVARRYDLTREGMNNELRALADRGKGAEAVLVYFSGHGVQDKAKNFLLPVDANLVNASSIPEIAVSVDRALKTIESAGANVNIFILDACRNAPF